MYAFPKKKKKPVGGKKIDKWNNSKDFRIRRLTRSMLFPSKVENFLLKMMRDLENPFQTVELN